MTYFESTVLLLSAMTVAVVGYATASVIGFFRRDVALGVGTPGAAPLAPVPESASQNEGEASPATIPALPAREESGFLSRGIGVATPRIAVLAPVTGVSAERDTAVREAVAAVSRGLVDQGAIVVSVGPIRTVSSGLERATAERLLEDADAAVFIANESSTGFGLGVGLATASALAIPKLVFASTDVIPQVGALLGKMVVQPLLGIDVLTNSVATWLKTAMPEIRERRWQRQATEDALAPLLTGLRERFQAVSSHDWSSAGITQERARLLLSNESVFAMSSTFEIAALSTALNPSSDLSLEWARILSETHRGSTTRAREPLGLSESEWSSLIAVATEEGWDDLTLAALVERRFAAQAALAGVATRAPFEAPGAWRSLYQALVSWSEVEGTSHDIGGEGSREP